MNNYNLAKTIVSEFDYLHFAASALHLVVQVIKLVAALLYIGGVNALNYGRQARNWMETFTVKYQVAQLGLDVLDNIPDASKSAVAKSIDFLKAKRKLLTNKLLSTMPFVSISDE